MVNPISASWNAAGGDWSTAADWNEPNPNPPPTYLHYVPGTQNAVDISNAGTTPFTVTYNTTDEIYSFAGNGNVIVNMTGGSLTIDNNSSTFDEFDVGTGATLVAASGMTFGFSAGVISGTLGGAGTLQFLGGAFSWNTGTVLSVSHLVLGVNGDGFGSTTTMNTSLSYAGAFTIDQYSGNNATLKLNGKTMTLTGTALLAGTITGPGTLVVNTSAAAQIVSVISGGATVEIKTSAQHVAYNYSTMSLAGTLLIDSGATFTETTTAGISDNGATSGISPDAQYTNNGTFVDDSGGGTDRIYGHFANNGTLTVKATDTLYLIGINTLGGTIGGAGTLVIGAGTTTLNAATVTVGGLGIDGGNAGAALTLGTNLTYAGAFAFDNQFDSLNLGGHTLTLTGASNTLSNTIDGAGTVDVTGTATVGYLTVGGAAGTAATLVDAGTMTQTGYFSLNGTLQINAGAIFTSTAAVNITDVSPTGSATVTNAGTFTDNSGGGISYLTARFTNSGTLAVNATDTLVLVGTNTLGGTIKGAGTLVIGAGSTTLNTASVTVSALGINGGNAGAALTLGTDLSYGGTFAFDNQFDTLNLNGHTLTLTGASNVLSNLVNGSGTITLKGSTTAYFLTAGATGSTVAINNQSTVTESQEITLTGSLDNASGAVFDFTLDTGINTNGTETITNEGTIEKTAGTGTSTIYAALSSTGTINAQTGVIAARGAGGTIAGVLKGNEIDLRGGGTYTLSSALSTLSVSTFGWTDVGTIIVLGKDFSYGGNLSVSVTFGTLTVDLSAHTLTVTSATTMTGAYGAVLIKDGGKVVVASGATADLGGVNIAGGVTFENAGALSADYDIYLDSDSGATQSLFQNDATGTVTITQDRTIFSQTGTAALITNAGKIVKTMGTGTSDIYDSLTNTGTLEVDTGQLSLHDGGSLGGTIKGAGALVLRSGGTYTLNAGVQITIGTLDLFDNATTATVAGNIATAAAFNDGGGTVLTLSGGYLLLSGAASFTNATVNGSQRLYAEGTTTIAGLTIGGTAVFETTKTATQAGGTVTVGDTSSSAAILFNYTGGTYAITDDSSIARGTSTGSYILNQGLFEKTGGTSTSTVAASFVDTGSVAVTAGVLAFTGPSNSFAGAISGAGSLVLGGATLLNSGTTATVSNLSITGSGTAVTLAENLTYAGSFTQGSGTTLSIGSGDQLVLKGGASLGGSVAGAGTLYLAGGTTTLTSGASSSVANLTESGPGTTLAVATNLTTSSVFRQGIGSVLNLTGGYLLLSGAANFAGTVTGSQRLYAEGATGVSTLTIGGTAVFEDTATVTQYGGTVTIGDTSANAAVLFNYTGATYSIADNSGIARGTSAASYILNQGLFQKTAGTGTSTVAASFVDIGTVKVGAGTLAFTGPANSFAGAIGGAGTLVLGGATTLKSGTTATVAALSIAGSGAQATLAENLTYGGTFTEAAGSVLSLTGGYLLLSGNASLAGTLNGSQRLYAEGTSTTISGLTIGGTAVLETTKAVTQAGGKVTVGDATSNAAVLYTYGGSVYSITDDSSIARGTAASSYILDQGTLQKTGGTGTSTIGLNITNNQTAAGTVGVSSGTLDLQGTLAGNLALQIGSGASLILETSAAAGSAASYAGGSGTLQLNDAQDYHGTIAGFAGSTVLDLRSIGFGTGINTTLGYSGTTTAGTLTVTDGAHTANLAMLGNYTPSSFHLGSDGHQGSAITFA